MAYCTTHEGEVLPCKTCAAIDRNKKLREEVAAAKAAMPPGMLDGPGEPAAESVMVLGPQDSKVFADALVNPPAPNATLIAASKDPYVASAEAYSLARAEERAIEEKLRSLESSIEAYKLALEAARVRTMTAKHALSQLVEQQ